MSIRFEEIPEDNGKDFYVVIVGEDNGVSVATHFIFYVYVPSLKINYLDPISGDEISLDEWRRQSKT